MTFAEFIAAAEAAKAYPTANEYIDSNDYPDKTISPRLQIARAKILWHFAADCTPLEIVRSASITATEFCRRYNINRRTFDNWNLGERKPPSYVMPALVFALIADCT